MMLLSAISYIQVFRNTLKKKFVSDYIWNLSSIVILSIAGIVINVMVGNYLDVKSVAAFNYSYSIYIVLSTFTLFGFNNAITKYVAQYKSNKEELSKICSTSLLLSALVSLLTLGLVFLFVEFVFNSSAMDPQHIRIVAISLPLYSVNQVLLAALNGLREMKRYATLRSMRWVFILAFVLIALVLTHDIKYALLSFLFSEIIMLILLIRVVSVYINIRFSSKDNGWVKKILDFGLKTTLTQSVHQFDSKLSLLLMPFLLSDTDVGVFSFAFSMSTGLLMFPTAVGVNFNPIISEFWHSKRELLIDYVAKIKKYTFAIVLVSSLVALIAYPFVVEVLMRSDPIYKLSIPVFFILMAGNILFGSVKWAGGFLPMIGEPETVFRLKLISVAVGLVLNLILINSFGIIGAAIATSLTGVFFSSMLSVVVSRRLKAISGVR